jgi:YaiO family outer membrane protein
VKIRALIRQHGLIAAGVAGFVMFGGVTAAHAQALNPFGNPFGALVVPQMTNRVEVGFVTADHDSRDTENDYAVRINHKVGKASAISGSIWGSPREDDPAAMFQVGMASQISPRVSMWVNFGGAPTSEHVPNAQYDFGGSFGLDPQLMFTGAASIRNYQGGPSVRLLAPGVVWVLKPQVIFSATAINSTVTRLAPGVTAGSNLALFNVILTPHQMITLNLGTGYGESDFLLAAVANSLSQNEASAIFDAQATVRFSATRGVNFWYWLDNPNGDRKTNYFQASVYFEF